MRALFPRRISCGAGARSCSPRSADGQRRRRGSDGVRLAAAVLVLVCCLLVIRYDSRIDRAITQVIHPPPWSITWLVTVVYQAGSFGVVIVLVGLALLARRWEIARDIGLSAAGTAAVSGILIALLGSRGGRPGGIVIDGYYMSFPGPADRPVHGGRHGGAAVSGPRRAAPHRDLHRPGGPGLGRRRSRAAAQRRWGAWPSAGGRPRWSGSSSARRWACPRPMTSGCCSRSSASASSHVHPVPRQVWGVAKFEATEMSPGGFARSPRYRGLRPGRGRRQAAHQGGPVPAVPGLRAEPDDHPASAGRARGLRHHASGPGGRGRARDRRGGNGGAVPGRAAGLPAAARDGAVGGRRRPRSATPRSMTSTASC